MGYASNRSYQAWKSITTSPLAGRRGYFLSDILQNYPDGGGMFLPRVVITGCGNPLFGDDGFGPAVISEIRRHTLPSWVKTIDGGTGATEFVFSLINPRITGHLIVIDAAKFGAMPGTVRVIPLSDLPDREIMDVNPGGIAEGLMRIKHLIRVSLVVCQPRYETYPLMHLGLSSEVRNAVPKAVIAISRMIHSGQYKLRSDPKYERFPGTDTNEPFIPFSSSVRSRKKGIKVLPDEFS